MLAIATVPINYFNEILGLFTLSIDSSLFKIFKDLVLVLCIFFNLLVLSIVASRVRVVPLMSLLFIVPLSLMASLLGDYGILGAISGFRSILPLLFILIICLNKSEPGYGEITTLKVIFYLQLLLQIYEFFWGQSRWETYESIGLSARNAGMFTYPSTAGYFAVFTYIFLKTFYQSSAYFTIAVIISTVLSGSFGALVVLIVYLTMTLGAFLLVPIFLLSFAGGYAFLQVRAFEDLIYLSLISRLNIFWDIYRDVGLFSSSFGYYSNTGAFILGGPTVDSTVNYILGSFGLMGLVIYFLALFLAVCLRVANHRSTSVLAVFFATSFLVSILEVYPANLLILMLIYRVGSAGKIFSREGKLSFYSNFKYRDGS